MSSYPPPGGYPPGDYQSGGYGGGSIPPVGPPSGKTQTLNLDYNVAALLSYVPCCIGIIFAIIWLATEPRHSKFVRFHALQGLFLAAVLFVLSIILQVISGVAGVGTTADPTGAAGCGVAMIIMVLSVVIGLGGLILHIIGMIKAYQGQMWKIPMIGDMADKQS